MCTYLMVAVLIYPSITITKTDLYDLYCSTVSPLKNRIFEARNYVHLNKALLFTSNVKLGAVVR